MVDFLSVHFVENLSRVGISVAKAVGVVGVDAGVFFFERDGECQDLAFGEVAELFGHGKRINGWLWPMPGKCRSLDSNALRNACSRSR